MIPTWLQEFADQHHIRVSELAEIYDLNCEHDFRREHEDGETVMRCSKCGAEAATEYCPICGDVILIGRSCPYHYDH